MALKMLVFACVGVAMEVVFTAADSYRKTRDKTLQGVSYVWMLPIYALVPPVLSILHPRVSALPLPARLALYVTLLFAVEYASGWLLRRLTGACPWEAGYHGKRWAVDGLIRLDYAPAWVAACFLFERLYLSF